MFPVNFVTYLSGCTLPIFPVAHFRQKLPRAFVIAERIQHLLAGKISHGTLRPGCFHER
jgi:hypothetical protein